MVKRRITQHIRCGASHLALRLPVHCRTQTGDIAPYSRNVVYAGNVI